MPFRPAETHIIHQKVSYTTKHSRTKDTEGVILGHQIAHYSIPRSTWLQSFEDFFNATLKDLYPETTFDRLDFLVEEITQDGWVYRSIEISAPLPKWLKFDYTSNYDEALFYVANN